MNQGWECPRCGNVNSPAKQECSCKVEATQKTHSSSRHCCACAKGCFHASETVNFCESHRGLQKICD